MADETLTDEQHQARAMLMGLIYIDWAHIYVDKDDWDSPQIAGGRKITDWLDADDLHALAQDEKMARIVEKTSHTDWRIMPGENVHSYARDFDRFE